MRLHDVVRRLPPGPDGLVALTDLGNLAPLVRALLVADGTVTDLVEAYHFESLELVMVAQEATVSVAPIATLALDEGAPIFERKIAMRGIETGRIRFVAQTVFALDRIGRTFREDLEASSRSLGEILRERAPTATREILGAGRLDGPVPGFGKLGRGRPWIVRSYRLDSRGQGIALVTECFPEALR